MDERKKQILMAIVQDYIATAEPVGSRTISRKYKLGVSPATIRNDMADLEEMGYIHQPHTSSGRIPSELGYRYYVDYLMPRQSLTSEEEDYIRSSISNKNFDLAQVIKKTCQLLANMTSYTSMISLPHSAEGVFKHIQLVLIMPGKALLILVTGSGTVSNYNLDIAQELTQDDLDLLSRALNSKLVGCEAKDLSLSLIREIFNELYKYQSLLELLFERIERNLSSEDEKNIYMGGILNILNQPEFKNMESVKLFMNLMEDESQLQRLIQTADMGKNDLAVKIGTEIKHDQINNCSLIVATYSIADKPLGSIGVLGPTRMEYSKVISIVDYLAKALTELL